MFLGDEKCGHGPWGGSGSMPGQMPLGMGYGMQCPACGESLFKPSNEQIIKMLEHKKMKLEHALEHINKEIERLKENKPEEKP